MKFTKEDAVKDLAAKFKNGKDKDLDLTRTINEVVDNLLEVYGDNEDLELKDFVAKAEKLVSTSAGLARKVAKDAVKTKDDEIAELKKKIPQNDDDNDDDDDDDDEPKGKKKSKYVTELEKRLKALEDREEESKKSKKIEELRKQLFDKIKEGGVDDEDWINDTLADIAIAEDMDVDDKADHFVKRYNKYHSDTEADITPKRGGGGEGEKKNPVLDDVRAKIIADRKARGLSVNSGQ